MYSRKLNRVISSILKFKILSLCIQCFILYSKNFKQISTDILIGKSTYYSFFRKSCYEKGPNTTNFYTPEKELENITLLPCSCERGTMSCPKGAEGPTPPKVKVNFSKTPKCIHL